MALLAGRTRGPASSPAPRPCLRNGPAPRSRPNSAAETGVGNRRAIPPLHPHLRHQGLRSRFPKHQRGGQPRRPMAASRVRSGIHEFQLRDDRRRPIRRFDATRAAQSSKRIPKHAGSMRGFTGRSVCAMPRPSRAPWLLPSANPTYGFAFATYHITPST